MTRDSTPAIDPPKSLLAKFLRPKVAIPSCMLFLLLISPWLIRGWFLRGVPNPPEPFDDEPLLQHAVPDAANAFTDYRKAMSLHVSASSNVIELKKQVLDQGWHLANEDVYKYLRDNKAALLAWKQGANQERVLMMPVKDFDVVALLDEILPQMRTLGYDALLKARQLEDEGDPQTAWEWYRSVIRASRHVGTHGGMIQRMSSIALFQVTAFHLERWSAHPDLTSDDLKQAIEQFRTDWELTEKPSTAFQHEYLDLKSWLDNFGSAPDRGMGRPQVRSPRLWYYLAEPELTRRVSKFYFHNQMSFSDLPRYQRPSTVGAFQVFDDPGGFKIAEIQWSAAELEDAANRSIVASQILRGMRNSFFYIDREDARYRTTLVTLAGQALRRDHGRFPRTLDELVPDYLNSIPLDNYDGKPLKYRFDSLGPVVYTVFENRIDDGGIEWSDLQTSSSSVYPRDYGTQMRLPDEKPVVAPKP